MRGFSLVAIGLALMLLISSVFVVNEDQHAVQFRFGRIVKSDFNPGLHFKLPMVDSVRYLDRRVQSLDSKPERFLTREKKDVVVDSVVKWKIVDVTKFYTSATDIPGGQARLEPIAKDGLRNEFNKRDLAQVVAGERADIGKDFVTAVNKKTSELGIEVIDVRVKRINLPDEVSGSVYSRMQAERQRVARELRAKGNEQAQIIRARANQERVVLLANAERDSAKLRGEGDATAAKIYAEAYGGAPEFYRFTRSLEAYRGSFNKSKDVIVLDPNSEFFRYFDKGAGGE
jgi:modulator of FtsH protease HflC